MVSQPIFSLPDAYIMIDAAMPDDIVGVYDTSGTGTTQIGTISPIDILSSTMTLSPDEI